MNQVIEYIIKHRSKKPNSRTLRKFKLYLDQLNEDWMNDLMDDLTSGRLSVETFECQVDEFMQVIK